jgi:hypothetical protein
MCVYCCHRVSTQLRLYIVYIYITYSKEQSPSWEADQSSKLVKKFPSFYGTRRINAFVVFSFIFYSWSSAGKPFFLTRNSNFIPQEEQLYFNKSAVSGRKTVWDVASNTKLWHLGDWRHLNEWQPFPGNHHQGYSGKKNEMPNTSTWICFYYSSFACKTVGVKTSHHLSLQNVCESLTAEKELHR